MKTLLSIPHGRFLLSLASVVAISPAFAQTVRIAPVTPPPIVREEVRQPGRPLLKPEPEPEIIEVISESEARAREKRAREMQKKTAVPPGTNVIEERIEVPKALPVDEGPGQGRRSSRSSSKKSSRAVTEGQTVIAEDQKPPSKKSSEEETVIEERRPTPKQASPSEKREVVVSEKQETEDAQRQIEQLQKKVTELQSTVAEARKEQVVETPPPAPTATENVSVTTGTTPLPISPATATDERKPLVVDTPPEIRTENTTVQTKTSTTGSQTTEKIAESPPKGERTERTIPGTSGTSTTSTTNATSDKSGKTGKNPGVIETIPTNSDVPVATKTEKPGFVTSPYPPHNVIDATGLPKGSLAKDPSTNKVFRVP